MKYLLRIVILLAPIQTQAQDISKLVNDYTTSYVRTGDFSGCIHISKNNQIIFENCFGLADQSFKVSNEKNTKFKIGSVSKQFTASAILIMEQKGLLKTTDTLSKFFPDNLNAQRITIHQLLNHTSGITDIYNVPDFNKLSCQKKTISELSKLVLDSELEFEPGTKYQYSNGGYAVLAEIIEKVNGQTFQDFLNKNIFYPLNMTSTGHNKSNEVIPNFAIGYDPSGYSDVKTTDFLDPELLKGSGSLYSTIQDLQIWINSIKNRSLLDNDSYEKFLTNYGKNYGYGISLYSSFEQSVFGHDGRVNGYIADYLHYKESDISIIILGNIQTGVADFFRRDIAAIVFNRKYESRAKTIQPEKNTLYDYEKILGTYTFGPNFKVYIEEIEGSIQARANEGAYSELIRLEDKRFFSRTLYSYIEFKEDDQGNTIKMLWTNNDGNTFEGQKE
jgi:CubicO group peptidase (beta-lactamase class C family)